MEIGPLTTPLAAFAAGMMTSFHCAAMCGPLGCALLSSPEASPRQTQLALSLYQGTRIVSYTILGGLLGVFGTSAAGLFDATPARLLPWILALMFLLFTFGADRWIPQPRFVSRLFLKIRSGAGRNRFVTASVLGAATPFLPCGPLYLVFGVALFAGSFGGGALLMASFAFGTLPFYWLAQSQLLRLRLAPATMQRSRRVMALAAALIVGWRAAAHTGTGSVLLDGILCH